MEGAQGCRASCANSFTPVLILPQPLLVPGCPQELSARGWVQCPEGGASELCLIWGEGALFPGDRAPDLSCLHPLELSQDLGVAGPVPQSQPPLCRGESASLHLGVTEGPLLTAAVFLVRFALFTLCSQLFDYHRHFKGFLSPSGQALSCFYNFRTPLLSLFSLLSPHSPWFWKTLKQEMGGGLVEKQLPTIPPVSLPLLPAG